MPNFEYQPKEVSPPGETLQDLLEERGISQTQLAVRLNRSEKNLNQIIKGKAPITPEMALDLERALGTPARFWLNREAAYRECLTRSSLPEPTADDLAWARTFPYLVMSRLGWVPAVPTPRERCLNLLRHFGVVSREAFAQVWDVNLAAQYRRTSPSTNKDHLIAAWLRQGEIQAEKVEVDPYNEQAFAAAVEEARSCTHLAPPEFVPRLQSCFARCGVILLFVPELPGMGVSGATRWLTPNRALIQITLRFKTNDHLWFTIFHESCHILKHPKKVVFLETAGGKNVHEFEADNFASNHMIPISEYRVFVTAGDFSKTQVEKFAKEIGIAPGIVVGRLQHDQHLPFVSPLNSLKVTFRWITDDE